MMRLLSAVSIVFALALTLSLGEVMLPALLDYQLSVRTPEPPKDSFDKQAANRGRRLFRNEAGCATCHQGPHFTDVLNGPTRNVPFLHHPAEVGMDPEYALRTATGRYRPTPLRALWQHPPYVHDGSARISRQWSHIMTSSSA